MYIHKSARSDVLWREFKSSSPRYSVKLVRQGNFVNPNNFSNFLLSLDKINSLTQIAGTDLMEMQRLAICTTASG
jgi:hypothetical protein